MQYGMYERIIDQWLYEILQGLVDGQDQIFDEKIDEVESPTILSRHMGRVLEGAFKRMAGDDALDQRIHVLNRLIESLAMDAKDPEIRDFRIHEDAKVLLAVLDARQRMTPFRRQDVKEIRPVTSLSQSSLFTGSPQEPSMIAELKARFKRRMLWTCWSPL